MAPQAPKYGIGDSIYLRESAALGFLEAFVIIKIEYNSDGVILYELATGTKTPSATMTIGDRNTGLITVPVKLAEYDLVNHCEAIRLAIANVELQLATLHRLATAVGCEGGSISN